MSVHPASAAYPSRQTPRLQNSSKTPLGNGSGWGFGLPGTSTSGNNAVGSLGNNLGGSTGFGSGLTSNRPAQLSGFAQVMGGGGGNSIDMSDFPSLSGGPQPTANAAQSTWNGGIIRSQSQQRLNQPVVQANTHQTQRVPSTAPSQQSIERPQSPAEQEAGGGGDEFPPLGGQINGDMFGVTGLRSPEGLRSTNGQLGRNVLPFRDAQPPLSQNTTVQSNNSRTVGSNVKRYADMNDKEKYGLEGLAAAYEARKAVESGHPVDESLPVVMRSGLFFGQDLNALGMDLDSPEPIWPTFTAFPASTSQAQGASTSNGVFDFHDRAIVPEFALPPAYTVTNVPPLAGRLGSLSDETLFCIFYQNPRDLLQEQAAQELNARDWRWHKVLRQWLQKDSQHGASANSAAGGGAGSSLPILDLTNGTPVGVPPQRVSADIERGVYIFFDVMNWRRERREFVLAFTELDQRFTPEMNMVGVAGSALGLNIGAGGPAREGLTNTQ
ncbi:hypothetical protein AMS68_006556 [Peltaster fructicola]|uniref:NOT2/NOT3/NOT5 C-terminal domain-containing protein n=1 Tax=Peltaster fructicola TaxID=286661 RepID=A0A6H0Y2F5_9PEZI|nr:hypothetical protein AMS68_006556 [Peltaster fructicola]